MKQMKTSTIRLGFTAALAIFLFALALLVTGSPLLAVPLSERLGLPLGNVITWFGMTALVMLVWFGSRGLRVRTRLGRPERHAGGLTPGVA